MKNFIPTFNQYLTESNNANSHKKIKSLATTMVNDVRKGNDTAVDKSEYNRLKNKSLSNLLDGMEVMKNDDPIEVLISWLELPSNQSISIAIAVVEYGVQGVLDEIQFKIDDTI